MDQVVIMHMILQKKRPIHLEAPPCKDFCQNVFCFLCHFNDLTPLFRYISPKGMHIERDMST